MFLSNTPPIAAPIGNAPPLVLWLNEFETTGRQSMRFMRNGGNGAPASKGPPRGDWKLYEFFASDPDGNRLPRLLRLRLEGAVGRPRCRLMHYLAAHSILSPVHGNADPARDQ